jgi:ribose 5-phosphate isomerase A
VTDALAVAAVDELRDGMTVGLGTGRAAARAIRELAARHLDVVCVATSDASAALARSLGLRVEPFETLERVDHLVDGADEVDPWLRLLKGRGGAMTREKIVAHAAARRVYLVQSAKLVERLGATAPLPIELFGFGLAATRLALRTLGLDGPLRAATTDDGNPIVDVTLPDRDPGALAAALDRIPGVVGHGLFLDEADLVLVEDERGQVSRRVRPPR